MTSAAEPVDAATAPPARDTWAPFGITVTVMTVAGLLVVGQMYAVIPLFSGMAHDWGGTPADMTWTTTLFGFAYSGGFLVTGPLADRFGRRRMITSGLVALAILTFGVTFAPSLAVGGALRVAQGLAAAAFSPAALAYLVERVEPRHRSVAVTCLVTSFIAAAVVGQLGAQAVSAALGWRWVFVINAIAIAVIVVLLRLTMLPDGPRGASTLGAAFAAMGRLIVQPKLAVLYVATVSVLGAFVAVYTALQLLGPSTLVGNAGAMLGLRASALPAMVAIPLLAPLLNRVRPTMRAALALLLAAAATLALAENLRSVVVIGLVMLVFVAAIGAVSPGLTELVGSLSGAARGSGVALYTFMLLLGASLGPQLVSSLRGSGFGAVMLAVCVVEVVGAVLVFGADLLLRRDRPAASDESR